MSSRTRQMIYKSAAHEAEWFWALAEGSVRGYKVKDLEEYVINNETSVTTAVGNLAARRSNETLVLIEDDLQLASPPLPPL